MKLEGDPVRQWRWHFTNRYISPERKPYKARTSGSKVMIFVGGCWEPANPHRGHREALGSLYSDSTGGRVVMIEQWHNHVQDSQVLKALGWLNSHLPSRLWLPDWAEAA